MVKAIHLFDDAVLAKSSAASVRVVNLSKVILPAVRGVTFDKFRPVNR